MAVRILYSRRFLKRFEKRILPNQELYIRFKDRVGLFRDSPDHPLLRDHPLRGKLIGFRAFSITGDIRLVYEKVKDGIILHDIGSHNQVY